MTVDGAEVSVTSAETLLGSIGGYSWEGINSEKIPGWLRLPGGRADGRDLFVCRSPHKEHIILERGVHPGELSGYECRYGYDGEQHIVRDDPFGDLGTLVNSPYDVLYVRRPILTGDQISQVLHLVEKVETYWMDRHGFVNIKYARRSSIDNENPVLFTSEYLFLLKKLGVLNGDLRQKYLDWAQEALSKIRLEPGIFDRVPEDRFKDRDNECFRHFSRDEQIGLVIIDWAFDYELGVARELYEYGKRNNWQFENRSWRSNGEVGDKICHHDDWIKSNSLEAIAQRYRTPKFQGFLAASVAADISDVAVAEILAGLKITSDRPVDKTSGKILAFLRKEVFEVSNSDAVRRGYALFDNAMYNQYNSNPMTGLFKEYFRNKDHPFHDLVSIYMH